MPKVGIDGVAFAPPIFDHSKVALIDEMTRLGLPPGNPFFGAVGEPASRLAYYYLWHFSAAELALLTGASGWEADIAMTWFTAFSSLALMLGLANWFGGRATALLWVLLLNAALSCRVVLAGLFGTEAVHQVLMPATGFGGWLFQAAWVPQHIAAASAVILALFFLGRLAVERSPLVLATLVLLAVAGYESSTWIGGVLFPVAAAMTGGMLLIEAAPRPRMSFLSWCAAAAILAICLAWPLLHDQFLATGLRAGGSPIVFRPFQVLGTAFPDGLRRILDVPAYWLLLLPIEFPAVYVTGAVSLWAYLRLRDPDGGGDEKRQAAKTFALLAAASLVCAGLFASTIGNNNDLGWRAVLPGVIVLTVFAAVGLSRWIAVGARAAAAAAVAAWLLGLPDGLALVRENAAGMLKPDGRVFVQTPEMWAAVRRHAAPDERVANNPLVPAGSDAVAGQPVVGAAVGSSLVLRGPRVDAGLHRAAARAPRRDRRPVHPRIRGRCLVAGRRGAGDALRLPGGGGDGAGRCLAQGSVLRQVRSTGWWRTTPAGASTALPPCRRERAAVIARRLSSVANTHLVVIAGLGFLSCANSDKSDLRGQARR